MSRRVRRETVGEVGTPFLIPERVSEMNSSLQHVHVCVCTHWARYRWSYNGRRVYMIAIYGLLMSNGESVIHYADPEVTASRDKGIISLTRIVHYDHDSSNHQHFTRRS